MASALKAPKGDKIFKTQNFAFPNLFDDLGSGLTNANFNSVVATTFTGTTINGTTIRPNAISLGGSSGALVLNNANLQVASSVSANRFVPIFVNGSLYRLALFQ